MLIEHFAQIKSAHVALVLASGSLFVLRGLAVQLGARAAMAAPVRYLSYAIDSALLASAIALLTIVPGDAYANGWLAAKLVLLVVYIALGSFALKRGRTPSVKRASLAAALAVYASIFAIARTHDPLGPIRVLLG